MQHGLMLLVGALHALAFAPYPLPEWALPYVQIGCLAYLARHTLQAPAARTVALNAVLFGFGQFALGLYWLYISMHEYGGMPLAMAIFAVLVLALALSLYGMAACLLARWLLRGRVSLEPRVVIGTAALWASCWTLGEWLRGTLFTGFPWMNIGYAHVEGMFAGWAPFVGVYGIAWLAAFASGAIGLMVRAKDTGDDARAAAAIGLALVTGLLGIGWTHIAWVSAHGSPVLLRLVQTDIPQSMKFDPARFGQSLDG